VKGEQIMKIKMSEIARKASGVKTYTMGMSWLTEWSRKNPEVKWNKSNPNLWIGNVHGDDIIFFYPKKLEDNIETFLDIGALEL
jgi:hypothetical protein